MSTNARSFMSETIRTSIPLRSHIQITKDENYECTQLRKLESHSLKNDGHTVYAK